MASSRVDLDSLLADLRAEGDDLDRLVTGLDEPGWELPTPAEPWTIRHQIAHLAWTDRVLVSAVTDPAGFAGELQAAADDAEGQVDRGAHEADRDHPAMLLARWRAGRSRVLEVLAAAPPGDKIAWFGPPMNPASQATARLMETWAHGADVAEALGVERMPTTRLRHVAHLGVRTLGWSFLAHGQPAPSVPVRVELTGPDGSQWSWGPPDAADRVTGSALDFCLRVTQRSHRADLDLTATGPVADRWLDLAQAFAGAPGPGRPARASPGLPGRGGPAGAAG